MPTINADLAASGTPHHRPRARLMELVEEQLQEFFRAERERWSAEQPRGCELVAAIAELVAAGGKRIRPAFCISGYLAAGGDPDDHRVVPAAAGLELLHACALIHDDIMDGSAQRRGAPTVHHQHSALHRQLGRRGDHIRFGESVAILAGDLAMVYADRLMATVPLVESLWAQLRSELIVGQFADVLAAADFSVDLELARWVMVAKSGRYTIHRPLQLGATIAGRPDLAATFEAYGAAVGEAFQLRDDLMDAFGDAAVTGKPDGLDFKRHKMTLLLGLAMQRDPGIRDLLTPGPDSAGQLRRRLEETGVRHTVEQHIDRLVEQGCRTLADAPMAAVWHDELTAMAHLVAYRDR